MHCGRWCGRSDLDGDTLNISERGLQFIASFEGYRARAYDDGAGVVTIGYGHALHRLPFTLRDRALYWTRPYALARLKRDAGIADAAVTHYARPLNQHEHDALVSFAFNCGTGALQHSTLLQDVNRHKADSVIQADFERWSHAGGVVLPGLLRRRKAEAAMFLHGTYQV